MTKQSQKVKVKNNKKSTRRSKLSLEETRILEICLHTLVDEYEYVTGGVAIFRLPEKADDDEQHRASRVSPPLVLPPLRYSLSG